MAPGYGVKIDSNVNSQALTIFADSNVLANKNWVINSLDSAGYLTGNQTITLTGPITGTGATTIATSITNSAVTYAKIQNETSGTLLGRFIAGTGPPGEISIGVGLTTSGSTLIGDSTIFGTHYYINSQGFFNVANNGLTASGVNVVLGQNVGQGGNPGQLLSAREIPFNGYSLKLTQSNQSTTFESVWRY